MFGLFIFGEKQLKICSVKKNNFKWTKLTIKSWNNSDWIQD